MNYRDTFYDAHTSAGSQLDRLLLIEPAAAVIFEESDSMKKNEEEKNTKHMTILVQMGCESEVC